MAKKTEQEPERFYAGGYYLTKKDEHTFLVPPGMVDKFKDWNDKHTGLQRTLEGLADYVAEQRGALYREQNQFWNQITDAIGIKRGTQAHIDWGDSTLRIVPFDIDKHATLKLGEPSGTQ